MPLFIVALGIVLLLVLMIVFFCGWFSYGFTTKYNCTLKFYTGEAILLLNRMF